MKEALASVRKPMSQGGTVTFVAMQLAYYMGFLRLPWLVAIIIFHKAVDRMRRCGQRRLTPIILAQIISAISYGMRQTRK